MLKFITKILEIINWIFLPLVAFSAFMGLAAIGSISGSKNDIFVTGGVALLAIYPVISIVGMNRAIKCTDDGKEWMAFLINLFLASPALLAMVYLILSYNGYKLFG